MHTVGKSGFVSAGQNNTWPHSANNCRILSTFYLTHNISHPTIFDFAGISQTYIQILPPNQLHPSEIWVCYVMHVAGFLYGSVKRPATQCNGIPMVQGKRKPDATKLTQKQVHFEFY